MDPLRVRLKTLAGEPERVGEVGGLRPSCQRCLEDVDCGEGGEAGGRSGSRAVAPGPCDDADRRRNDLRNNSPGQL